MRDFEYRAAEMGQPNRWALRNGEAVIAEVTAGEPIVRLLTASPALRQVAEDTFDHFFAVASVRRLMPEEMALYNAARAALDLADRGKR